MLTRPRASQGHLSSPFLPKIYQDAQEYYYALHYYARSTLGEKQWQPDYCSGTEHSSPLTIHKSIPETMYFLVEYTENI
jgi:hypothetical protein